jgi:parallel beta-helix repeat protein
MLSRKIGSLIMISLLVLGTLTLVFDIQPVKAGTIVVPIDYAKIQWAIGNASDGDRIEVRAGSYSENVIVDKRVTLVGEGREVTTIDGMENDVTMRIRVDNVSVSGFKITRGYKECLRFEGDLRFCMIFNNEISFANERGIWITGANNSIHDNLVHDWGRYGGIDAVWSHNNTIFNNDIYNSKPGWWGLSINNGTNNQMYNNTVYSSSFGVFLDWSAADNSIFNNTFRENSIGIGVSGSSRENSFWNNQVLRNGLGIAVMNNAAENTFTNNSICDSGTLGSGQPVGGMSLSYSTNNHLRDNVFTNNTMAFQVDGDSLEHYLQDIDLSNTINGKPIRYLLNQHDMNITQESGLVALINSTNMSVDGLVISKSGVGVLLAYTNNSVIRNITASDNGSGISLVMSNDNVIIDNEATGNLLVGIFLSSSSGNKLRGNRMTNNSYNFGIGSVGNTQPTLEQLINDVDVSNTVDGKPIYYLIGASNRSVPADAGCVLLLNSTNIVVRDLNLEKNVFGVAAGYSSRIIIENVTVRQTISGIPLVMTSQSLVRANTVDGNAMGITVQNCFNNITVTGNKVVGLMLPQGGYGPPAGDIVVLNSTNAYIRDNNVSDSPFGILIMNSIQDIVTENRISGTDCGVNVQDSQNVNVSWNTLTNSSRYAVFLNASSHNNIVENNIITNGVYGIYVSGSLNNGIVGNSISANYDGIVLFSSSNNNVAENNLTDNLDGVVLYHYSSNNSIIGNTFTNCSMAVLDSYQNTVEENIVNGKPLLYLEGVSDYTVGDAGQVILINCSNIRVENLDLSSATVGLELWGTTNSLVANNNITANNAYGIGLFWSPNNDVLENNITDNENGIWLYESSNNSIVGNSISANNWWGIGFFESSNNVIYHNNLVNNTNQVYSYFASSVNVWDNGLEGNYWSDYTGLDANGDGIGDTPHTIDLNNQDRYPFMSQNGWKNSKLEFILTPNPAFVGQTVTLLGNLIDRLGNPINNTRIDVYVNGTFTGSLFTNPSGGFTASAKVDTPRTYIIKVSFNGSKTYNPSSHTETLTVYPKNDTKVSFTLSPNPAKVGQTVTVLGNLTDIQNNTITGAPLEVYVKIGAGPWQYTAVIYTNSTGRFQAAGKVTSAGTYQVAVLYRGSYKYNLSYRIEVLTVNP